MLALSKIIIFHHHLLAGGVTDVIFKSIEALAKHATKKYTIQLVVGSNENLSQIKELLAAANLSVSIELEPLLAYANPEPSSANTDSLYRNIRRVLLRKYFSADSLWWIHNYHLGKNPCFTKAILEIINLEEQKILLHIHDFPECGRPKNLSILQRHIKQNLYPIASKLHYVVINPRDYKYLLNAGMPKDLVSCLYNPMNLEPLPPVNQRLVKNNLYKHFTARFPNFDLGKPIALYPVRSIRRKNVLELGLLNILLGRPLNILVTLPGKSKDEIEYSNTVALAYKEGLLDGLFAIGLDLDAICSFDELCSCADFILSSSILEGFGYLYFNASFWNKKLISKELDILSGFDKCFAPQTSLFYKELLVGLSVEEFQELQRGYKKIVSKVPSGRELLSAQLAELDKDAIDFSYLSVKLQLSILRKLVHDNDFLHRVQGQNSHTLAQINKVIAPETAAVMDVQNRLTDLFGYENFTLNIEDIFTKLGQSKASADLSSQSVKHEKLIAEFTQLQNFRPLLTQVVSKQS